jgi:hypothetical protein
MKNLLPLCLMLSIGPTFGQSWEPVAETDNGTAYFYDAFSVKRDGDLVTFWELVDYPTPLRSGKLVVASSRSKIIQDCKNNRFKVTDLIDYDGRHGSGKIVNIELVKSTDWYLGTPESINEALKNRVCL